MANELLTRKLKKIFQMYDLDQSEFLEAHEFVELPKRYLEALGIEANSSIGIKIIEMELKTWKTIKNFDTDGYEKITLEEYVEGWEALHQKNEAQSLLNEFVDLIMQKLDINGDGRLSRKEYSLLAFTEISPEDFSKLDTNGNGYLSKEEVKSNFVTFFTSKEPSPIDNICFGPLD